MGARGQKPKPTALKQLAGNAGKRPMNESEPVAPVLMDLKPPSFLNKYGKAEWKRIVPELLKLNLLGTIDRTALAGYCNAYGTWEDANRELRKPGQGMITYTEKGYPIQNPLLNVINKQSEIMKGYLVEFGMTPAARSRVTTPEGGEADDEFTRLQKRKFGGECA